MIYGEKRYVHTKVACYLGYVTQAVVNNFAPLLFLIFQQSLGVSLENVTVLITINFSGQLIVDLLSSVLVDRIGYRPCVVAGHLFAASGLIGLAFLPTVLSAFEGLLVGVILYSLGGGLLEVILGPIIEACPTQNKSSEMSLLHSFYCWGAVIVIAASTCFLLGFGRDAWPFLSCIWAILPLANALYFCFVPIATLNDMAESMPVKQLLKNKYLWLFALLILTAGASEMIMSQWASTFAESGLGVPKWIGDIAGPCLFAALMGVARIINSRLGKKFPLRMILLCSGLLCLICYLLAGLASVPVLALVGCALCGFSVGALWPGVFSISTETIPRGGTAMFAFLALAGDAGGVCGPSVVGIVADRFGGSLQTGLLVGCIFPILFIVLMLVFLTRKGHTSPLCAAEPDNSHTDT